MPHHLNLQLPEYCKGTFRILTGQLFDVCSKHSMGFYCLADDLEMPLAEIFNDD